MTKLIPNAKGAVTPSTGPVATLPSGDAEVTVEWVKDVDGVVLARVIYPGGFTKHHQLGGKEDVAGLLQAVTHQFTARFGAGRAIKTAPKAISDNLTLIFGE